jgi:hypothetical protein
MKRGSSLEQLSCFLQKCVQRNKETRILGAWFRASFSMLDILCVYTNKPEFSLSVQKLSSFFHVILDIFLSGGLILHHNFFAFFLYK